MIKVDQRKRGDSVSTVSLITFLNTDSAEQAVNTQEHMINGEKAKISYAKSLPRRSNGPPFSRTRLYVTGIGQMTENELSKLLGNCSLIYPKKTDLEAPYVFAQYENEKDKREAMDNLNGKKIDDKNILKLSPAYAQRSRPRRRTASE